MILLLVFAIGLAAGFVDAIAGGGGLIMLPGLLFSGLPVGGAIATNKLCGTCGAIASTLTFAKSKQIDWRACAAMGIPAVLGAYAGSRSIGRLPTAWAEPAVIVLILMITAFVVLKPELGMKKQAARATVNKPLSLKTRLLGMLLGAAIGFHDGFFGPGTGIFLVFVLLSLWSLDFLKGTGTTKVINLLTNITALATFAASGNIDYTKGIVGAIGVGLGSFIGATFATKKGAKLIKPLFVAVAIALVAKLLFDTATN